MEQRRTSLQRILAHIFPKPRDFVCEFGCGHGHFLTAYAQSHPSTVCVGLDIESDRVERAKRKQERAKATQLHFIQADASLFLETLPAEATFSDVYILFPDPWPKKRHHKHRIIQSSFLEKIHQHATTSTRIFFRTDFEPYFEDAHNTFERHRVWQPVDEPWPFEHETVFQSRAASYRSFVARLRPTAP